LKCKRTREEQKEQDTQKTITSRSQGNQKKRKIRSPKFQKHAANKPHGMHMELKREVKLKLDFATETETRFFNKIAPFESLKTVFQDTC